MSGRSRWLNSARYGRENSRCRVRRQASSGVPSAALRPLMMPYGTTEGMSRRRSERSNSYSPRAISSLISLTAMTRSPTRTKRTTCREMPRGSAAR